MAFNRITDPQKIRTILDGYIKEPRKTKPSFVATIFSREHRPGGIIYVGHCPIAACQTEEDRIYTLATSDSNYTRSVGTLRLSGIEYVEVLG